MILAVFASREQPPELHRPSSSGSIREGISAAPGHPAQLQGVLTPTQHPAKLTACGSRLLLEKKTSCPRVIGVSLPPGVFELNPRNLSAASRAGAVRACQQSLCLWQDITFTSPASGHHSQSSSPWVKAGILLVLLL